MNIITRKEWGAAAPKATPGHTSWAAGGELWVHYSEGPPPSNSASAEAAQVRAIQAFHQGPDRGWNDIGYNYLVAPSGRIYEGRGFEVVGAHCPNHNHRPGVCLLWKSGTIAPPPAALNAVLDLGHDLKAGVLRGHREGYATTCPGDAIYSWVKDHRDLKGARESVDATSYLRLDINGQTFVGWNANQGRLRWIVQYGLKTRRCGLAWRAPGRSNVGVWRNDPDVIRNVARSILAKWA